MWSFDTRAFMLWQIVVLCSNIWNVQFVILNEIFIWFGSFPFCGERAQVQRDCKLSKWLFLLVHQKWSITLALNSIPVYQSANAVCGLWITIDCKVFNLPILGRLVFLRNRVSAIWACAWPEGTFGLRQYSFFLRPPPTLSMNCLPAYSPMLSLMHQYV